LKIPKEVIRRVRTAKREVGEKGVGEGGEGGRGRGWETEEREVAEEKFICKMGENLSPPKKNVNK
jgi:hypothetical protein